jgi:hypothetical protein
VADIREYFDKRENVPLAMHENAKYAIGAEKAKARACFLSIPKHLRKTIKSLLTALLKATVQQENLVVVIGGSHMWLYDAGIIYFCYKLSSPELPLEGNAKGDAF